MDQAAEISRQYTARLSRLKSGRHRTSDWLSALNEHPLGRCFARQMQHRLQPQPDRDMHPPFVRRDQKDDSVVLLSIADRPFAAQPIAIIGDIAALEIADRRNHQLMAGLFLQFEQLRIERRFLARQVEVKAAQRSEERAASFADRLLALQCTRFYRNLGAALAVVGIGGFLLFRL